MAIDKINATALLDGGVSTADIADDAITTAKIADSQITDGKIAAVAATKLTGTIADARFPSTLPAISGANLTGVGVAGISSSADATAITIDSSENVGIGTTSPTENLHIKEARSSGAGMVPLIKVQTTTNNATGDGSAIAFHGEYNSTEWGFGKIGGANSGANFGGALEFHTNAGNGSSASVAYTKQLTVTHDGRGLSQFTAKAWMRYDQDVNTVRDSHNVSSVTDHSLGVFTMNFANNLANQYYCVQGSGHYGGSTNDMGLIQWASENDLTTSSAKFYFMSQINNSTSGTLYDAEEAMILIFGD